MNEQTRQRSVAVGRIRRAYEANGIPWTGEAASKIQRLPIAQVHDIACCWEEAAAAPKPEDEQFGDDEEDEPAAAPLDGTLHVLKKILLKETTRNGINCGPRHGQRVFLKQWADYHGRGGSVRY